MGRVLTNNTSLAVGIQSALDADPTVWELLEPEAFNAFGNSVSTVARNPISKNRQRRKGTVTDLDSTVEFEHDLTKAVALKFLEGFVFSIFANPNDINHIQSGADFDNLDVTSGDYTHDALDAAIQQNSLVYARGFAAAASNGLKEVATGGTTTTTPVEETIGGDETPTQVAKAQLDVAGHRLSDATWTDATSTLGSTLTDMTTLGLTDGQLVRVGNPDNTREFANGSVYGRIVAGSITAASVQLDKLTNVGSGTLDGGGDEAATDVDFLFGRFLRNVSVDDADFLERYFMFEAAFQNLGNPSGDEYEYARNNLGNNLQFNVPLTEKATATFGFVGTDTDNPTASRKAGAATPVEPQQTTALNTSSDIARLRLTETDETGLTTCFKSLTLTLNNGVTAEKCLGTLGALFLNNGNFEVDMEAQILFTDSAVVTAIRENRTVTMDLILRNDDGGMGVDIPAMTLGDGAKEFPVNESVLVNLAGQAHQDPTLGTSIGISMFPFLPSS